MTRLADLIAQELDCRLASSGFRGRRVDFTAVPRADGHACWIDTSTRTETSAANGAVMEFVAFLAGGFVDEARTVRQTPNDVPLESGYETWRPDGLKVFTD